MEFAVVKDPHLRPCNGFELLEQFDASRSCAASASAFSPVSVSKGSRILLFWFMLVTAPPPTAVAGQNHQNAQQEQKEVQKVQVQLNRGDHIIVWPIAPLDI
jgi:hypothetical protein